MKLPTTTRARLNLYRQRAAKNQHGHNDWRGHRYGSTWGEEWHNWAEDRRKIYADARDTLGNYLGDWPDIMPRWGSEATGFYVDCYCNEAMQGGVERIRTARGTLYIPATYCTGWDGVTYYMADAEMVERGSPEEAHDKAKQIAASYAYNRAEIEAEEAREQCAKDMAADDISTARAEIHKLNKGTLSLLAEIRKAGVFSPAICQALTNQVREQLAERRAQFKTIAEREANYWSAVSY